jgi:hypothetical protein
MDPGTLADILGFQDAYERKGLDLKTARSALTTWGLVTEPPQDYTVQGFLNLLDQYGPIFIAANVGTESRIANHSRVITGLELDTDQDIATVGTSGPAGTDMITGLYSAAADSIPILCITGQAPRARLYKEDFQAVEIVEIAKPVAKWAAMAREPALVPRIFQQAFHLMRSGRPGPALIGERVIVCLNFPKFAR